MATPTNKMWLKRVLIPLWVLELIILAIFFILACILLGYASSLNDDDTGYYYTLADAYK